MSDLQSAGEALYRSLSAMPCTCLTSPGWPFRSKVIVDGKPVDPPDEVCRRCRALRGWEAAMAQTDCNGPRGASSSEVVQ